MKKIHMYLKIFEECSQVTKELLHTHLFPVKAKIFWKLFKSLVHQFWLLLQTLEFLQGFMMELLNKQHSLVLNDWFIAVLNESSTLTNPLHKQEYTQKSYTTVLPIKNLGRGGDSWSIVHVYLRRQNNFTCRCYENKCSDMHNPHPAPLKIH